MLDLKRKIIFTHPKKCAGTSIEHLFGWLPCTKKTPTKEYRDQFVKEKHTSLDAHLERVRDENLDASDFFIFSCVRNPWDRAVSLYFHRKAKAKDYWLKRNPGKELPKHLQKSEDESFQDFLLNRYRGFRLNGTNPLETRPYTSSSSGVTPNFIIRYEKYNEGVQHVAGLYGLDVGKLQRYNSGTRPADSNYKDYYTNDVCISIVGELGRDAIDSFGYFY
jgi:hypothetical protein